ncbi:MAG TPA: NAD(P)H-dependent oxidoreductase subunit E [Candidatus Merdiplasma excrementigallinarum]|uniref:NAD(P)H-dependent oxidoreductase subunit E n=1 Tax=Candidatus Merdiplasma excrementigallinarum TaxID=2840864 RepID=A0A9D1NYR0_9FIRM|nr:NAD(P)H-dependent oxidoreductase subunit E [Candidatus Merdiplasma excrementigallinarum]
MSWSIEEAIAYYRQQGAPQDQGMLIELLREVQRESKGILSPGQTGRIAAALGIKETLLLALIRRIPDLRLGDEHLLELCTGPNCGKCRKLADFVRQNCQGHPGLQVKAIPCMRQCQKGPNLRFDGQVYHGADEALVRRLLDD